MFRIATTETYDPAHCVNDWIKRADEFDFVLFITKIINDEIIKIFTSPESKWAYMNKPGIMHITCTGWGATLFEPRVGSPNLCNRFIAKLIESGYPVERIVLRVDPIIPIQDGVDAFDNACKIAEWNGITRVRSSVMQMYKHVYERICSGKVLTEERCHELSYNYNGKFFPDETLSSVQDIYDQIKVVTEHYPDITFESCASNVLTKYGFVECGCMSEKDLLINGIDPEVVNVPKGNQRQACMCLLKEQLIPGGYKRGRCPNRCVYCYLKDKKTDKDLPKSGELF